MKRSDYLRRLANALDWLSEGKEVQFLVTHIDGSEKWLDYTGIECGYVEYIRAEDWRLKESK